ncbi:MAG: hypothetical protein ACOXZW_01045 [Bacilli bacterium]|jgi:hypothetical protein|nr:hypothetical protein [Bacilli bacterium]
MKKALLSLLIVIGLVGCGPTPKEKDYTKEYQELEVTFLEAGKSFVKINEELIPTDGNHYSIKLGNLYLGNYLKKPLIDPESKEECNKERSFIHVRLINNKYDYVVFLECGKYMTNLEK